MNLGPEFSEETSWGFQMISEEEMKRNEEKLKKDLEDHVKILTSTHEQVRKTETKLSKLRDMVMPLLTGLLKDPQNEYLRWPNRETQVQSFIDRINAFVESE